MSNILDTKTSTPFQWTDHGVYSSSSPPRELLNADRIIQGSIEIHHLEMNSNSFISLLQHFSYTQSGSKSDHYCIFYTSIIEKHNPFNSH